MLANCNRRATTVMNVVSREQRLDTHVVGSTRFGWASSTGGVQGSPVSGSMTEVGEWHREIKADSRLDGPWKPVLIYVAIKDLPGA